MNLAAFLGSLLKNRCDPFYYCYLKDRRVLDVGCGQGEFLAVNPRQYIGIDVSDDLVALCRRKGLTVHRMSGLELAFEDGSFDAVRAAQFIEHLEPQDAARFLAEAERVLVPGGVIFLTTPGVRNVWNTFSHVRPYPPTAIRKFLSHPTEEYVRPASSRLVLCDVIGQRTYSSSRLVQYLLMLLDVAFPARDPIGWTMVLRKGGERRS